MKQIVSCHCLASNKMLYKQYQCRNSHWGGVLCHHLLACTASDSCRQSMAVRTCLLESWSQFTKLYFELELVLVTYPSRVEESIGAFTVADSVFTQNGSTSNLLRDSITRGWKDGFLQWMLNFWKPDMEEFSLTGVFKAAWTFQSLTSALPDSACVICK